MTATLCRTSRGRGLDPTTHFPELHCRWYAAGTHLPRSHLHQTGASSAADGSVACAAFGTRRPASNATAKMASALRP
jgi:hypothetical protein